MGYFLLPIGRDKRNTYYLEGQCGRGFLVAQEDDAVVVGEEDRHSASALLQQRDPLHLVLFPSGALDLLLAFELGTALHHLVPLLVARDVVGVDRHELADAEEVVGVADDLVEEGDAAGPLWEQRGQHGAALALEGLLEVDALHDDRLVVIDDVEEERAAQVRDAAAVGAVLDQPADVALEEHVAHAVEDVDVHAASSASATSSRRQP